MKSINNTHGNRSRCIGRCGPWAPVIISVIFAACSGEWPKINLPGAAAQEPRGVSALGEGLYAKIETDRGEILLRLEFEKTPLAVCNFAALAEGKMDVCAGKPFYNGLTFWRVVPNFMIQGGDPLGNGAGGPGYQFPDEFDPSLRHGGPGVLSMANAGPGTNGSQFFITHTETPWLDDHHTVFGNVVEGQDVVNAIRQGDHIRSVSIIRNGAAAAAFKADQNAFNALLAQAKEAAATREKQRRENDLAQINQKYPDLQNLDGVRYQIIRAGSGPKPTAGSVVQVNYRGEFLSGEVFDASETHGGPLEFSAGAGQVIPGWDRSVMDMRVGEQRLVVIPPELAYGERGAGNGAIPPNSYLVFTMELAGIK
ncbi:MAG: peptidylprolyl isomerase [Treponema sp.]|jgi:peptidylprolyl isomerase|nr:peptidylprolyl isomerase [Treponema sp.]